LIQAEARQRQLVVVGLVDAEWVELCEAMAAQAIAVDQCRNALLVFLLKVAVGQAVAAADRRRELGARMAVPVRTVRTVRTVAMAVTCLTIRAVRVRLPIAVHRTSRRLAAPQQTSLLSFAQALEVLAPIAGDGARVLTKTQVELFYQTLIDTEVHSSLDNLGDEGRMVC
jgi:hypothetical protein